LEEAISRWVQDVRLENKGNWPIKGECNG
jgi:hypothetical protein